jgi:hypothetical protein
MKRWPISLLLLSAMLSCGTLDLCDDDNESILVARFKSLETGEATDTTLQGCSVFGIRNGLSDSLLYDSIGTARLELPLDPGQPTSRFVISNGDKTDTLSIHHKSEAYLISYNCGFAMVFTLDSLDFKRSLINSVEIISASIDAELETNEEHLWIYF